MNFWKNLYIQLKRSMTRMRKTGVITTALLVLRTGELKTNHHGAQPAKIWKEETEEETKFQHAIRPIIILSKNLP